MDRDWCSMTLEQCVQHLELELRKARPSAGSDAPALMKRISALESEIARLKSSTPTKPAVYTPAPAPVVAKPADMGLSIRLTNAEREIEKLKVKESPGAWLDWTPTVTGWAAGYTVIARHCKIGKMCFVYLRLSGTSNATNATATLPLSVSGEPSYSYFQVPMYSNNSVYDYTGGQCLAQVRPSDEGTDPNYVWFFLDGSATGWTASGTKTVITSLFYEVA